MVGVILLRGYVKVGGGILGWEWSTGSVGGIGGWVGG